nr:MAG: replication associated protein [Cressdnaviricota sp.]
MTSPRNNCFTLNNYTEDDVVRLLGDNHFKYIVFGREIAKTGTPHLQGYFELRKVTKFNTVRGLFLNRASLEGRLGSQEEAVLYCKKGEQTHDEWVRLKAAGPNYGRNAIVHETGVPNEQGARRDLDNIRGMAIEEGMRRVTTVGNMQQIRVAERFLTYNEPERDWVTEVIWISGASGVGKSRRAREICNPDDTYTQNRGGKWWDGYDGHEDIILDDFRDSWWSLTDMLALLDRYGYQVEVKGGHRQIRARRIIVTSVKTPDECYGNALGNDREQLRRRISQHIHLVAEVAEVGGVILDPPIDI